MNVFKLSGLIILLLSFLCVGLYYSGEVDYLAIKRRLTIEVNGTVVQGEVLQGRTTAIVTTRAVGKEHSYKLFFAGDTDMTGNMGFVVDCHRWVAPHFPFLLETRHHPPCKSLQEDGPEPGGWPLMNRGNSMLFITKEGSTVKVNWR
jgi:hypothetical protein